MPLSVARRNRMYRLLDPTGNIERTARGNAVDGGGHKTRAQAEAQRRAIEAGKRRNKMAGMGTRG